MRQVLATLTLTPHNSTNSTAHHSRADHRGHALRLSVAGALDIATAAAFNDAAIDALQLPVRLLVLDFNGVTFCDAAGISALVRIHRTATEAGTRCVLTGLQPAVQRILDLVGLGTILRFPAAEPDSANPDRMAPAQQRRAHAAAVGPYGSITLQPV